MERFPRQHGSRDAQNPPRSTLPSSTNPVYYTDRPSTNLYHTSSSQHRHTTAPACRGSYPRRPHAPLVPQNSLRPTKNQKHVAGQDRSPYGTASSPAAPDRMKRKKKPALCPRPSHLALCLSLEHATGPGLDALGRLATRPLLEDLATSLQSPRAPREARKSLLYWNMPHRPSLLDPMPIACIHLRNAPHHKHA